LVTSFQLFNTQTQVSAAPKQISADQCYISSSLARLKEEWEGEPAGSFTVWYSAYSPKNELVEGFDIRSGKGPPAQASN
jgi:hypothetical protein